MRTSYPMSEADREIRQRARTLADELLPHEVEAELHGGELPDGLLEAHRGRVAELGLEAINMPKELGGGGFTAFQQVLVQEQIGRVTNALGWVVRTPAYSHSYPYHHPVVAFEDVRIPQGQLIGAEGDGMRFAYEWFRYERLMIAARALGAAERLIEESTAFARRRQAYGRPIFDYQAIQFMLADSVTELWAARLMTYQTAHGIDADLDVKVQHAQCSMAKLYASEMAGRVADRAVQIFGGRGYMRENVAERFYRELRVDRIWEGTSEIQRAIIADQLAKRGVGRLTG